MHKAGAATLLAIGIMFSCVASATERFDGAVCTIQNLDGTQLGTDEHPQTVTLQMVAIAGGTGQRARAVVRGIDEHGRDLPVTRLRVTRDRRGKYLDADTQTVLDFARGTAQLPAVSGLPQAGLYRMRCPEESLLNWSEERYWPGFLFWKDVYNLCVRISSGPLEITPEGYLPEFARLDRRIPRPPLPDEIAPGEANPAERALLNYIYAQQGVELTEPCLAVIPAVHRDEATSSWAPEPQTP